jgi:cyclin B
LIGITCVLIAAKLEEVYPPMIRDLVYITDDAYTGQEICSMELNVLETLNYDICIPTCYSFLCHYSVTLGLERTSSQRER